MEVEVALQREADERCNGVLEFFGEFCGLIRRGFLRSSRERVDAAGDDGESVCKFQSFQFSNVACLVGMNFDNRVPFLVGVFASILDTKKRPRSQC